MEQKKKVKVVLTIVLFFAIAVTTIYIIQNKDVIFTSVATIKYGDGCIEEYKNDVLVTPICERGREIHEAKKAGRQRGYEPKSPWEMPIINLTV